MKSSYIKKGFTLIELLLYVSISSAMLLVISLFLNTLIESRVKNQTIIEVEQQGTQVMYSILQSIRNADSINSPSEGNETNTISLEMESPSLSPTIFEIQSGKIVIEVDNDPAIDITNSNVVAADLNFHNTSKNETPGSIKVEFTLSYDNQTGRNEYEFSKTFTGSASLRPNQ